MNHVSIIGNLGADPELRFTADGTPVCNLRVATNRSYTTKTGERVKETTWHRVVVWGKQAESCKNYLSKGRSVAVQGRIEGRDWEDKDGVKRYSQEIRASEVEFLPGGKKNDSNTEATEADVADNA